MLGAGRKKIFAHAHCKQKNGKKKNTLVMMMMMMIWTTPFAWDARSAPFHPRIHNLGNVGLGGLLHAKLARASTHIIDERAYGGRNVRRELARKITDSRPPKEVLEVGCGVGTMTQELLALGYFDKVVGIDTSRAMIQEARCAVRNATFYVANGCDVGNESFGTVLSTFLMHELPTRAHVEILQAMMRTVAESATGGQVWIVDIDLSYTPSALMRTGEPFIDDYLFNFDATLRRVTASAGHALSTFAFIPGQIRVWVVDVR